MSEGQFGAQRATTTTTPAADSAAATPKRKKRELAEAYQVGPDNWSARARREGGDIFVSGFKTQTAAERELRKRVSFMEKHGKPHGDGPDRTSVAQAMQQHALKHLPSLKGADQEARRINKYLRAARLGTLELIAMSEVSDVNLLTGHKTLSMVKRYVNVGAADVVKVMNRPDAAPPTPATQAAAAPAPAPAVATQEALAAAMQMLQAAAAQLSGQAAAAGPAAQVPGAARSAENDADPDSVAA